MGNFLKQSTSRVVHIGPFVDVTNGYEPETAVTLTGGGDNADEAEALKGATGTTVDISANTWAAMTGCDGWYKLTLSTGDTDTLGELVVVIQNDSVHLPVHKTFYVIPANVYDSLVAGTDNLEVDAKQISGSGPAADNAEIVFATDFATNYSTTNDKWQTEADLTAIGGTAQSATDLKDFADSGYDPATHKVAAVGTTDVATDVTNMVTANAIQVSGSATAADNMEVVFATDFATNYSGTTDKWQVEADVLAVNGSGPAADNMEIVFATDFATNYDTTNDVWVIDASGVSVSATGKDSKMMLPGRPFATVRKATDDTVDNLTDGGQYTDSDGNPAEWAMVECNSANEVRYAFGATPTQGASGLGHDLANGDIIILTSAAQIEAFKYTSATNAAASAIIVTFGRHGIK